MTAIATSSLDGAGLARKGLARKGLGRKGLDHCERITPFARSGLFAIGLATAGLVAAGFGLTPGPAAAGDTLQVTNARVPASDQVGIDLPLLMTIRNDGAEADAIRFHIAADADGRLRLQYVLEKNCWPVRHGFLDYADGALAPHDQSEILVRQAAAFISGYLRRRDA